MAQSITNKSVWEMDFAAKERRRAIAKVPAMRRQKDVFLDKGLLARGVWGNDVSAMDSRSVKRSLQGFGGMRVLWWKVASRVLVGGRSRSMEQAMYGFHRTHHAATFFWLDVKRDFFDMLTKVVTVVAMLRSRAI